MPIEILDPRTGTDPAAEVVLTRRPETLRGKRLGLLDNSKRHSKEMLEYLAAALRQQYDLADVVLMTKPSPSASVSPEMAAALKHTADLVIAGIGD